VLKTTYESFSLNREPLDRL